MAGESRPDPRSQPDAVDWTTVDDRDAIRMLYELYASRLRAFCMRRLGNRADAEDAVQETFLKATQAWHRFDRTAPAWPWLVTIAAHVCADTRRLRANPARRKLEPEATAEPDEQLAQQTKISIVDEALRSLPARYRTSIYLRHFEESSYEDIAYVQGTTVASVKSVLLRGRRRLGHRIEALARMERQWPLPSTVSMVAQRVRQRLQAAQRVVDRIVQSVIGLIDSVVSLGTAMAHAPAAMIAVGALTATAGGGPGHLADLDVLPPVHPTLSTAGPPAAGIGLGVGGRGVGLRVGGDATHPPPGPTLMELDTPTLPVETDGPVPKVRPKARDHGHDNSFDIYIDEDTEIWMDCNEEVEYERLTCESIRTAFVTAEEHDPDGVDPGIGTRPHEDE